MTPSSPSTTTLTARSPEDLLAASAVVLGFWPTDSVVMLTFDATHPFHARVDLPDDVGAMAELAATLARPAAHHHVGRVVLLVYSRDAALAEAAWAALRLEFARLGIAVVEALRVGDSCWHPLLEPGAPGVEIDAGSLAAHPFLAQAVVDGRVLRDSRDDLAASIAPDVVAVARIAGLVRSEATDESLLAEPAVQLAEGSWVHAAISRHLSSDPSDPMSDADVARLLTSMRSLQVRDAAWAALTRDHARRGAALFADIVRRAPDDLLPAAAALLAWAAWQSGDGALAWCALDRCERVDPHYGLAGLIAEALERAVPPTVMSDGFDWKEGLAG